ncbi:MAG: arylesterase [Acidihalobacter sp.]|jgi:acyl-CoA thioesterase-1|uniref:arylesterase n=1 Tax=Acidihalobacter sp. TaxID=1872108 RepID=UPI00307EEC14
MKRRFSTVLFACAALFVLACPPWAAAGEQRDILVLGDSLSAGYGLDPRAGWVSLLQQRLHQQGYRYRVINASVSGDTTSGGLQRLPKALERYHPALLIIELGGNDGLRGTPLQVMRGNLRRLIGLGRDAGARVLLLGVRLPPNYGPAYVSAFENVYAQVARETHTPLVAHLLRGVATDRALMQADGIHPKARAQQRLLDNVWTALRPLL